jgi:hypothetical protein
MNTSICVCVWKTWWWLRKFKAKHLNPPPLLNMFAITLCDFKCSGMDYVKIITYLSLSDPVPLQSTVSLQHPCCGITYYTNPTTAVLLACSLPTSLHSCKYRSARTYDSAPKRRFDFVRVGLKSRQTSHEEVVAAVNHSRKFQTACLYCDSAHFRRHRPSEKPHPVFRVRV